MPAFVRTKRDEKKWTEAKAAVRKQYPALTEDNDRFWALCNTIYHKMIGTAEKSRSVVVVRKAKRIVGHTSFQGIPIAIETPAGHERHWVDPFNGTEGKTRMEEVSYGEIIGSPGLDGDFLDCFIGPEQDAPYAYLVMIRKPPEFLEDDELKCFLGFRSQEDVLAQFQLCYSDPRFVGSIRQMPINEFRLRVLTGETIKSSRTVKVVRQPQIAVNRGGWVLLKGALLWIAHKKAA